MGLILITPPIRNTLMRLMVNKGMSRKRKPQKKRSNIIEGEFKHDSEEEPKE